MRNHEAAVGLVILRSDIVHVANMDRDEAALDLLRKGLK